MLKKRLIFTLLYDNGNYMLSRNFNLQKVGGLTWIKENYNFDAIAHSIDELVVLNVSRGNKQMDKFSGDLGKLVKECFMPLAAGGGIRSLDDGYKLMRAGADKLVVNSVIFNNPKIVEKLAKVFGSQSIIASLDCKMQNKKYYVYKNNGTVNTGMEISRVLDKVKDLGVGEIYLTSIEKDGTGQGYDLGLIQLVRNLTTLPIIISGGVGKYEHFLEGLKEAGIEAVATAHIYYFIANGLINARQYLVDNKVNLATWKYDSRKLHGYFTK